MKIIQSVFLILFIPSIFIGQTKSIQHKVYFDKNKFEISEKTENEIDSIIELIQDQNILKVFLFGNTDNDADSVFNRTLSEKRTKRIKDYLLEIDIDKSKIIENSFGEERPISQNYNENGKQLNRRVDIRILYEAKQNNQPVFADTNKLVVIVKDSCDRDTTILLRDQTQVLFNICEYKDYQNCIDIQTANNPNDLLINGMSLSDTNGFPIASCGMIKISLNPNCSKSECLKYPITVRFPLPEEKDCNICGRKARVWGVGNNGRWSQNQGRNRKIRTITIDGKKYYQMKIKCLNSWTNCDCHVKYNKVKFVIEGDYKFLNLKILYSCPTALYEYSENKKSVKTLLPCFSGEKRIIGSFLNKKGDTMYMRMTSIDSLEKRILFSRCKKDKKVIVKKLLGVFPLAKREIYRKYIIPERLLNRQK